jgi:A/G-specific adenine glycosylase
MIAPGRRTFFVEKMLDWYHVNARNLPWRTDREPYHVWLSEIMLQQTRVETVKPYYTRFLAELPAIRDLAGAEESKVFKLWEGLGYYSRARNLQKAAREIMERHGGRFPQDMDAIRALPGIGDYTAGAIASICFEAPAPAVDGNVLRVAARLTGDASPADAQTRKKEVAADLQDLYPQGSCGNFTQSLMELGALVCLPGGAAKCSLCPVADVCVARANGTAAVLPARAEAKERRQEDRTVLVLKNEDGALAVRKRRRQGLLAGLWEFPNAEGRKNAGEALEWALGWGVKPVLLEKEKECRHVFTHIEWRLLCYFIRCETADACEAPDKGLVWADARMLRDEISLPSAFRKIL